MGRSEFAERRRIGGGGEEFDGWPSLFTHHAERLADHNTSHKPAQGCCGAAGCCGTAGRRLHLANADHSLSSPLRSTKTNHGIQPVIHHTPALPIRNTATRTSKNHG